MFASDPLPLDSGDLIPSSDVERRLGVTRVTLSRWRSAGYGPRYLRIGRRAMYDPLEVEAWIADQRGK